MMFEKIFKRYLKIKNTYALRALDWINGQPKIDPWAFIRVCNERETLEQSLNSILGAISKGIIVYNECTDGSDEIIKQFCLKNPGFICKEFPYNVMQCRHHKDEVKKKRSLAEYYNFALSFIPKNEWFIKIDTDQIYDCQKLKASFSLPKSRREIVCYFRMELHCFDGRIYIHRHTPIKDFGDHWLLYNKYSDFFDHVLREDGDFLEGYEMINFGFITKNYVPELNTWHFPYMKASRRELAKIEDYVPLSEYHKVIPQEYLSRIALDMLDEERILKFLKGENEKSNNGGGK